MKFPVVVHVLRRGNLVYIRNHKCASSFFGNSLSSQDNWQDITLRDIDWSKDHVFSHIMDPVERRHKGITQYLKICKLSELYINSPALQKLLQRAVRLDYHTFLYHDAFGQRCWDIDWIPLTTSNTNVITLTEKYLSDHGLNFTNWDHELINASDPLHKQVEQLVKQSWENHDMKNQIWSQYYQAVRMPDWPEAPDYRNFNQLSLSIKQDFKNIHHNEFIEISDDYSQIIFHNVPDSVDLLFQEDIKLWNAINQKFNPDGKTWKEISWLTSNK